VSDDVWIGIDLGTQSVRTYAVAAGGRVAGSGTVSLPASRDGDRHEQDPLAWWDAVCVSGREALRDIAPERVRGVATCATSGTVLLVDRDGEPLTPGLMYDDARAGQQARRIGAGMSASWGLPKLLWMCDEWPQFARAGARLAHQADVVTRRLAGHDVPSDSSHALKSGYDPVAERWSPDAPAELVPEVVPSGTLLGEVCARAAEQTAIPAGTPLYAGMTDSCAAQLAAGALREGDWNSVLGTTLVLKGFSSQHVADPAGVLYSHRAPGGGWLPGGASGAGAGVLSAQFAGRDLDDLGRRAAAFEGTSVLAYPLVSRGERFPFAAADAEAFMLGRPADEAERFAALLQGVAFVERLCFDYVDLLGLPADGMLTLTGGATRSRRWCQLRADVLGRDVRLVEQPHPAVGMAILAASAGGDLAGASDAFVRTSEVIEPRTGRGAQLGRQYLRLVAELVDRGWLGEPLAEHARARARAG